MLFAVDNKTCSLRVAVIPAEFFNSESPGEREICDFPENKKRIRLGGIVDTLVVYCHGTGNKLCCLNGSIECGLLFKMRSAVGYILKQY